MGELGISSSGPGEGVEANGNLPGPSIVYTTPANYPKTARLEARGASSPIWLIPVHGWMILSGLVLDN
jgi:hypothetical protein